MNILRSNNEQKEMSVQNVQIFWIYDGYENSIVVAAAFYFLSSVFKINTAKMKNINTHQETIAMYIN